MHKIIIILLLCLFVAPSAGHANEGAGLLVSDRHGAFPKALWRGQPRSEITYLLKNLPADAPMRSIQNIKRNMLLSTYDTSLIDNDIEIKSGEDLLTLRLQKLMEMGLWEDAFTLFTTTTKDPGENNALAQIGVLLILTQKGLPTACLEAKVLGPRFRNSSFRNSLFWHKIDIVCSAEMDAEAVISTQLSDSPVLQAIYNQPYFNIPAKDIKALEILDPLELALMSLKKRINYQQIDLSQNISPYLLKIFLQDYRFPSLYKQELERIARQKALLPESPLSEELQKQEENIQYLTQNQIIALISHKLKSGQSILQKTVKKLAELAPDNPKNYVYIQLLNDIKAVETPISVSEEKFTFALGAFTNTQKQKVNLLKTMLDKPVKFSNNPSNVYEKQQDLTLASHYVIPKSSLVQWLTETQKHHFAGLSLLIVLSNIEDNAYAKNSGDISEEQTLNVLKNLSTVGLIEQARHIAREELANMMRL